MTSNLLLFLWDNVAMLSCKRIILFTIQPQTFFPAELDTLCIFPPTPSITFAVFLEEHNLFFRIRKENLLGDIHKGMFKALLSPSPISYIFFIST
jgi:hypothetical protein